jgi:hypothetical protein
MKNPNIKDAEIFTNDAYITWSDDNLDQKREALSEASKSLDEFTIIDKTTAYGRYAPMDFSNLSVGPTSGRPGLTRSDYDAFRPDEAVPKRIKGIIAQSDMIYNRVGLVKNVIDLMGDFASQGIRISHPDKKIENFYRNWFAKVNGADRSERFLNNLYRLGNVVINRQTAKISPKVERTMYQARAVEDMLINYEDLSDNASKREIPWKYTFIDPVFVDIVGGPLSSFVGKKTYAITLPSSLRKIINNPKNDAERAIVAQLPTSVIESSKTKKPYVLDPEKTKVFHYKKDDWKTWAYPIIYSIMDDINIIEKLKLADIAALDGAISNIRIFKLGSLDHKIAPTPAAAGKLSSILQNHVGGGTMDLVWGPDIELLESKTNVHQFLGESKYTPHLNSVYAGLGIPPTLTGTFGAAGTTNNFISLKTLTQRLQYGRRVLTEFWNNEIKSVQKAMGFDDAAVIEFDRMDLSNEEAEKSLIIQLADRNIISDEHVQTYFGINSELEKSRLNREQEERNKDTMVQKAGPYYDPEFKNSLRKIAMQIGLASPSEIGLDLEPKKEGEQTVIEAKACPPVCEGNDVDTSTNPRLQINQNKPQPQGVPGEGRPKNSTDTTTRKKREFTEPQSGVPQASLQVWALEAQEKICGIMNNILLEFYDKKNMRSLSADEYSECENIKTKILFSLEPGIKLNEEKVLSKLNTIHSIDNKKNYKTYQNFVKQISTDLGRQIISEELKYIKAYFFTKMV